MKTYVGYTLGMYAWGFVGAGIADAAPEDMLVSQSVSLPAIPLPLPPHKTTKLIIKGCVYCGLIFAL